jgi:hypothetical protein
MTDAELDALEKLNDERTQGAWRSDVDSAIYLPGSGEGQKEQYIGETDTDEDCNFIAACSAVVPALIATLRAERETVRELRGLLEMACVAFWKGEPARTAAESHIRAALEVE